MWSYYGSKSKVIDCYPKPKFDKIIEPFAGTARYALKYFDKDVLLVDKYYGIIQIWKWLQKCSPKDINDLPNPKRGDDLHNFKFDCKEAQLLMRFMIGGGLSHPQWIVSPQGFGGGVESGKKNIIKNLYKIKHWHIVYGEYHQIQNQKATWFIDPPYQFGGHKYIESNKNIDFIKLAKWCIEREGQQIVCENTKANWLPFKSMKLLHGSTFKTTEAIYSNFKHAYNDEQTKLFA